MSVNKETVFKLSASKSERLWEMIPDELRWAENVHAAELAALLDALAEAEKTQIIQKNVFHGPVYSIMTVKEASERWGVSVRPIIARCAGEVSVPELNFSADEARAADGTYLITKAGMERCFGPESPKRETGTRPKRRAESGG